MEVFASLFRLKEQRCEALFANEWETTVSSHEVSECAVQATFNVVGSSRNGWVSDVREEVWKYLPDE